MLSVAGTRGGLVRLHILISIKKRPQNVNELAMALKMDYTTIQYHIRVLLKSNLITSPQEKYDNKFTLAPILKFSPLIKELKELWEKAQKDRRED